MSDLFARVRAVPLAEVVTKFFPGIELKRDGHNLAALCPLHLEKTASFKINPQKNRWKCFGSASCGGGTSIDLIIKAGLACTPIEAAKMIAAKFNIEVKTRSQRKAGGNHSSVKQDTVLQGLTVAALAVAKKLDEKFLKSIGLRDVKYRDQRAVLIPYLTRNSEIHCLRYRLSLDTEPRFVWRSGDRINLYGLERITAIRRAGWVLLVEGESDCWTGWQQNLPVLGVPGKTAWKSEWKNHFDGMKVYIWQEPGAEDFTDRISRDLDRMSLYVIEAPEGIKDISEAHLQGTNLPDFIEELKASAISAEELAKEQSEGNAARLKRKAAKILAAEDPVDIVERAIRDLGYGGKIEPALITYLAATSRLLKMRAGSMPVHLLLVGVPSSGKSYTLKIVALLLPDDVVHEIDAGSPRSLIYDNADLTHKIIIFGESDSLPMGEDNPAASAIRNLLQEHQLRYSVVVRDAETRRYTTQNICKTGPSVLITTAVRGLGPQLGSRLFSLEVPDDAAQVRAALATQAGIELNGAADPNEGLIAYQAYLQALAPWDVLISYADQLAEAIGKSALAPRMLRDFSRVLSLVKGCAILRHRHRQLDGKGRLIATIDDYRTIYELVREMYQATVTGASERVKAVIGAVVELGGCNITVTGIALHLKIPKMAVTRAVRIALKNGWLINSEFRKGFPFKLEVGEALPDESGLPHPDTIKCNTVTPETDGDTPTLAIEDKDGWEAVL